jgi:hypothetical protein
MQRLYNLVVTNVPGPQFPLYMLGRRLRGFYPKVPLTLNTALGIAIMSYDGQLDFGLLGDYDAMPDLEHFADDLRESLAELVAAAASAGEPAKRTAAKAGAATNGASSDSPAAKTD